MRILPGTGIDVDLIDQKIIYKNAKTKFVDFIGRMIPEKGYVSFIYIRLNLIEYLSVKQNIALVNDNSNSSSIDNIISELGLDEKCNQKVKNLSFGEAQRVAIARGVINNPKVIFADEPTSALDDTNTEIVMKMIFDYADSNDSTLVVCTHDDRVKRFFSNLMVIK